MAESRESREIVEKVWTGDDSENQVDLQQKVGPYRAGAYDYANGDKVVRLLIDKTNETAVDPFDIISDHRSVTNLCLIYSSMVSGI